jgi:hypothetical protein
MSTHDEYTTFYSCDGATLRMWLRAWKNQVEVILDYTIGSSRDKWR